MESAIDYHTAKALLEWQIELGVTEAIGDVPIDRYALDAESPKPKRITPQTAVLSQSADPIADAHRAASGADDLAGLQAALENYSHCELKNGARSLVFSDGKPEARVMIIGEAPGRDEDRVGRPFVGRAGQLLDRMLAAIGLSREAGQVEQAVYITNVLPWRPPQNRDPLPEEIAMLRPFVERHVELIAPDMVVLMGNISCQAGLGQRGVTRLRGKWSEAYGRPAMPMFHPAYLLRNPQAKREAWADLLDIQARLRMLS